MKQITALSILTLFTFTQCEQSNSQTKTKTKKEIMENELTVNLDNSVVFGNNQFANDLFENYSFSEQHNDKNIFFSPFSIYSALAMTSEGAKGETALEIQKVLHLPEGDTLRQSGFENLITSLNSGSTLYKLTTANALWAQKKYTFLPAFIDVSKTRYKANAENLDFIDQPETARKTINTWVEQNTNNKIKELLSQKDITKDTRLILTNTIYFKGEWARQFEVDLTKEEDFTTSNGSNIKTQMMHIQRGFPYLETEEAQVLEMPYKNNELSMIVILPKKGHTLLSISNTKHLTVFLGAKINHERLQIAFPRFKIEAKYLMKKDLYKMGMSVPFGDKADFSGMTGSKELQINQVIHQTFVEVNEAGTEATAATAVGMEAGGMPKAPKPFIADHPFIFAIRHNATGAILFMGALNDPNEK
ncbi:MAG: serpin family protein [Bacteroidota bacterium]